MHRTIKFSFTLLALNCALLTSVHAQAFTPFTAVDYRGDWQTLPKEQIHVEGTQRLWYVLPQSWQLGRFSGKSTLTAADASGFTIEPKNVWGDYAIHVRIDEIPATTAESNPSKNPHFRRLSFHDLPEYIGQDINGNFDITDILRYGESFRGTFETADGDIPVTITPGTFTKSNRVERMPDIGDLRYGPHAKHLIDIYYPEGFDPATDGPLPTIVNIHGGGWGALYKDNLIGGLRPTQHGYAIASIAYRYISEAHQAPGEMTPPVTAPLYDAARAVQHLRQHAKELGLDPNHFGATGGSAGGATTIWLALHDDLADPDSDDPVSRQSTRLQAAVPVQAQSSLDLAESTQWVPEMTYGGHAFFKDWPNNNESEKRVPLFMERRETILDWIKEFSPIEHVSSDDPPLFARNSGRKNVPEENATHHPRHTEVLVERLRAAGAKAWFWAENQDADEPRYNGYNGVQNFWDDHLGGGKEQ